MLTILRAVVWIVRSALALPFLWLSDLLALADLDVAIDAAEVACVIGPGAPFGDYVRGD